MRPEDILRCFSANKAKRPAALRQLFNKKITSSSLYWGLRYDWLKYANLYPQTGSRNFDAKVADLIEKKYLILEDNNEFRLSKKGEDYLRNWNKKHFLIANPELFADYDMPRWLLGLRLIIQVLSETTYSNRHYLVVTNDFTCQTIVKQWFHRMKNHQEAAEELFDLLAEILGNKSDLEATIFANLLVGHNFTGFTLEQVAEQEKIDVEDARIVFMNLAGEMLEQMKYSNLFASFAASFRLGSLLPESAWNTYQMFRSGMPSEKIISLRRIRPSTFQEHLIDAAIILPDFPFDHVLNQNTKELLDQYYSENKDLDHWNYHILAKTYPEISFFDFRLYQIKITKEIRDGSAEE